MQLVQMLVRGPLPVLMLALALMLRMQGKPARQLRA
jgi:hypothetical protein